MKLVYWYVFLMIICTIPTRGQSTYYISSAGNDTNDGRSITTPFKTLDKINTITLQPGDKVALRRGDTFRGTLTIQQSGNASNPISIDAYGSGNKPIIAGSIPVTNWSNIGTNLWQASCSSCGTSLTGLYNGDAILPLGRYPNLSAPNKGYLTIKSHSSKNQFVSQEALATDWTGGEVVYRPVRWILNRAIITQQSSNTLTIDNSSSIYDLADGWGYFIQNHPATLDQNGEWYYNPSTKTVRLFNTANPNIQNITATVYSKCVNILNTSFVSVKNLTLTQPLNIGFYAANSSNLTVSGVDMINSGEDGMAIHGTGNNITIENNLIDQPNNNGIELQSYTNIIFRDNLVKRVALVPGRGKSGDGQYRGFDASATTNMLIENNKLDSIGYSGITFSTQTFGLTIQKNTISNFCMTKSDGGGIYTWNGTQQSMNNIKILSNIIYNAMGATEGSPISSYSGSNGIYIDQCAQNIQINDNTVFNCYGIGIFLISVTNITARRNTSFDNKESQLVLTESAGTCHPRNNIIKNNILVGKTSIETAARYESSQNDLDQYGDIDSNYYARPFDDVLKIGAAFTGVNTTYGLHDWQLLFGKDINSRDSPVTYTGFKINSLTGSNRINNSSFISDVTEWYQQSPYYNNGKNEWDNTNRLDGGSMKIYFQPASGFRGSFVIVFHGVDAIVNGKSYVLKFDAVASANGKTIQTFIRKRFGSQELALRTGSLIGSTRKHYEVAFTATLDEPDAVLIFQTMEDGQSVWIDNVSFQEATITRDNPDDLIKLVYNPSVRDTTINLVGNFRDVRNQLYSRQITLTPYTAAVLFLDTAATVDLKLVFQASNDVITLNAPLTMQIKIRNANLGNGLVNTASATWVCRLPPNVTFITGVGITNTNGVLTGQVNQLAAQSEAVFTFQVRLTMPGNYQFAAEISTSSRLDANSTPGSGTSDGEDDMGLFFVRTTDVTNTIYTSPNPNPRILPVTVSNQPVPPINKADLRLSMSLSNRSVIINQVISCTITVVNSGGLNAAGVQVQNYLPSGFQFIDGTDWVLNGSTLTGNFGTVIAGTAGSLTFRIRPTISGTFVNNAQVFTSSVADPDSQPANGITNGEDDQTQADIRVR